MASLQVNVLYGFSGDADGIPDEPEPLLMPIMSLPMMSSTSRGRSRRVT